MKIAFSIILLFFTANCGSNPASLASSSICRYNYDISTLEDPSSLEYSSEESLSFNYTDIEKNFHSIAIPMVMSKPSAQLVPLKFTYGSSVSKGNNETTLTYNLGKNTYSTDPAWYIFTLDKKDSVAIGSVKDKILTNFSAPPRIGLGTIIVDFPHDGEASIGMKDGQIDIRILECLFDE